MLSHVLFIHQRMLKTRLYRVGLLQKRRTHLASKSGDAPIGGRLNLEDLAEDSWKIYFRFTCLEVERSVGVLRLPVIIWCTNGVQDFKDNVGLGLPIISPSAAPLFSRKISRRFICGREGDWPRRFGGLRRE